MKEIRGLAGALYQSEKEEVQSAIKRILTISLASKKEGILALEAMMEEEAEDYIGKHFLKKAVENLCDGMTPEKMNELMTNRILAETDSKKQFICLLYKTGMNLVASGEHIRCVQNYISSLFPESCEDDVLHYMEQVMNEHYAKVYEEKLVCVPKEFQGIHLELPAELQEQLKTVENVILGLNDMQVQTMLRNAENFDVCSLLLAGTEEFRSQILHHMSERLRIMIMEDVIERGKNSDSHCEEEIENIKVAIERTQDYLLFC